MGDTAIRQLVGSAESGRLDAVNSLWEVGTPEASPALATLLWSADSDVATRAAWRLGNLLIADDVKSTLREFSLAENQRKADWLDWVWEPFGEPKSSALPVIAGRIGHLILRESPEAEAVNLLETRLGLALCVASMGPGSGNKGLLDPDSDESRRFCTALGITREISLLPKGEKDVKSFLKSLETDNYGLSQLDPHQASEKLKGVMESVEASGKLRRFLSTLPAASALRLVIKSVAGPMPTIDDWRQVFRPSSFNFGRSWQFFLVLSSVIVLGLLSFLGIYQSGATLGVSLFASAIVILNISTMISSRTVELSRSSIRLYLLWPAGALEDAWKASKGSSPLLTSVIFRLFASHAFSCGWVPIVTYFTFALFSTMAPWYVILAFWLAFAGISSSLWFYALRLQRRSQNVLHGIVDPVALRRSDLVV